MKIHTTKDSNEAAMLLANGIPLRHVQRQNGVCYFIFSNSDRTIGLTDAFWRGDLMGNIRAFTDAQRRIKDMIFRNGYGDKPNGRSISE